MGPSEKTPLQPTSPAKAEEAYSRRRACLFTSICLGVACAAGATVLVLYFTMFNKAPVEVCKAPTPPHSTDGTSPTPDQAPLVEKTSLPGISIVALMNARRKNERTLQTQFRAFNELNIDRYVNFFDKKDEEHFNKREWYTKLVTFQSSFKGKKSPNVRAMIFSQEQLLRQRYSHLWVLDDDLELPPIDHLSYMLRAVEKYDPLIASPALPHSPHKSMHPMHGCAVRSVDFVEVQAPILQIHAAIDVYTNILNDAHPSDWGVDQVWCKYLSSRYNQTGCIVVNSASVRTFAPVATDYSQSRAQDDERQMISEHCEHQAHHVELECLEEDKFTSAEAVLPSLAEVERRATAMRMYVYDVPRCKPPNSTIFGQNNFDWEHRVERVLRETFLVTEDPRNADFFFLPACPINKWADKWKFSADGGLSSCHSCVLEYETELITAMRMVGPYYDTAPEKHLMTRLRCPFFHEQQESNFWYLYPMLWENPRTKFICLETKTNGGNVRETDRELQVPYFAQSPTHTYPKRRNVGFVGSMCCGREKRVPSLPDPLLLNHFVVGKETNHHVSYEELMNYTGSSRIMYQPTGDTPERQSVYQSIASGTPVVFDHDIRPPLRHASWGAVALNITRESLIDIHTDPGVVSTLANYDVYMERDFKRDRANFLWHTSAFNARFRQLVASLFWQGHLDPEIAASMSVLQDEDDTKLADIFSF